MATGLNRLFGPTTQARMGELRRQALVATSEVSEAHTAAGDYPRRVSVLRREQTVAGNPALGLSGTWATVAGLANLVGHVRTAGQWEDEATQTRTVLAKSQRVVMVADVPAAGAARAGELLTTDRLQFDDPIRGVTSWDVTQVRVRKADGIVVALVEQAREERA